ILGVPYVLLNQEELAALALAVIGGYAVKAFKDYKTTINEWVKPIKRIEPREEIHEKYLQYAEFYEKLIEKSDELFEGHEKLIE
ncbi:MAG: xylulose kinase, partial [Nitrososphaerota archaeon]